MCGDICKKNMGVVADIDARLPADEDRHVEITTDLLKHLQARPEVVVRRPDRVVCHVFTHPQAALAAYLVFRSLITSTLSLNSDYLVLVANALDRLDDSQRAYVKKYARRALVTKAFQDKHAVYPFEVNATNQSVRVMPPQASSKDVARMAYIDDPNLVLVNKCKYLTPSREWKMVCSVAKTAGGMAASFFECWPLYVQLGSQPENDWTVFLRGFSDAHVDKNMFPVLYPQGGDTHTSTHPIWVN